MTSPSAPRVIAVTGASSGIGEAICRNALAHGAFVVINARRSERLEQLKSDFAPQLQERIAVVAGDAADSEVVNSLFSSAKREFGLELDAVVVNAGRGLQGSVTTADLSQLDEIVRTNIVGALSLMRHAAQEFQARRKAGYGIEKVLDIVVMGSTVGNNISPFSAVYGSTKYAVHSLADALRRELAPHSIRVSTVAPGIVVSEFQQVAGYDNSWFETFASKFEPLLQPQDVARAVQFILDQPAHSAVGEITIRPSRQDYP